MPDEPDHWQHLIEGLRAGENMAVREFCDRYGGIMRAIADKHLSPKVKRRVEADDVVQSVFRTFFRRAKVGQFQLPDSDSLWRLLCAITLTKVREQVRFQGRAKRGLGREVSIDPQDSSDGSGFGLSQLGYGPGPTPADAAEFADQFRLLIESLGEEEKQLVALKLDDMTNGQIAEKLGCSERTVRRLLKQVQVRLKRVFEVEGT
jgi:RNA polymerase sigma-70 factor (ECF subfamily)